MDPTPSLDAGVAPRAELLSPSRAAPYRVGLPCLVVSCAGHRLALSGTSVETILDAPPCHPVPDMAAHAAGVANHAGAALVVYDVRKRIGVPSAQDEIRALLDTLAARKEDHVRWLATLREQVAAGERITVQRDPHLCAFGKWYDQRAFDNSLGRQHMDRFDAPHQAIHAVADRAARLIVAGREAEARALVHETESGELRHLVWLFDSVEEVVRANSHAYVVVCERAGGDRVGLLVDELCELSPLEGMAGSIPWMSGEECETFTRAVGRVTWGGEGTDVLLVDLERLIDERAR